MTSVQTKFLNLKSVLPSVSGPNPVIINRAWKKKPTVVSANVFFMVTKLHAEVHMGFLHHPHYLTVFRAQAHTHSHTHTECPSLPLMINNNTLFVGEECLQWDWPPGRVSPSFDTTACQCVTNYWVQTEWGHSGMGSLAKQTCRPCGAEEGEDEGGIQWQKTPPNDFICWCKHQPPPEASALPPSKLKWNRWHVWFFCDMVVLFMCVHGLGILLHHLDVISVIGSLPRCH